MTTDYSLERGLPVSLEAERTVLGSILMDTVLFDEASQHISHSEFSLDAHRRIFIAMRDLRQHESPIDMITLIHELDRRKELEAVGGAAAVSDLITGVPERPSILHYIRIVREKAMLRAVINASQNAIVKALDQREIEEVLGGLEQDLLAMRASSVTEKDLSFAQMVWNTLGAIDAEGESTADVLGLTTTIPQLDELTTGFRKTEVWTLGAFPGRGKTAFAKQIASGNAKRGVPVKFFEIEMDEDPLIRRILAAEADVSAFKLRNPRLLTREQKARVKEVANTIAGWPLLLDTTASLSITELLARARLSVIRDKAELVIVDHIGLIDAPGVDNTKRLENVSKALRAFAKQTKVPVLQLSHLSNPPNKEINRPPTMLDLKYSGDIAGHSHVVLLLYVPESETGEPTGMDQIIVGKMREGEKGPIDVRFNTRRLEYEPRFSDRGSRTANPRELPPCSETPLVECTA
jgi:replicative DNA helicase